MQTAALVAWLLTAAGGLLMLGIWMVRGGLRQVHDPATTGNRPVPADGRPTTRFEPWKLWAHIGAAVVGLIIFGLFMMADDEGATGHNASPWLALAFLVLVAGLGASMVVPWLEDRRARRRRDLVEEPPAEQAIPLAVVVLHGAAAAATVVLVLLVAIDIT
jgi:manganese efflux pump family protein